MGLRASLWTPKSRIRNDRPLLKFITGRINVTISWEVRRKGRCRNRWLFLRDSCNPKFDNVITYCNSYIKKKFNFLLDMENIECPFLLFSQISTDIWFFVTFNILLIRVHPPAQPVQLNRCCLYLTGMKSWLFLFHRGVPKMEIPILLN